MHVLVASKHVRIEARRRPAPRNAFKRRGVRPLALQAERPGQKQRRTLALWQIRSTRNRIAPALAASACSTLGAACRSESVSVSVSAPDAQPRRTGSPLHPGRHPGSLAVWRPLWYSFAGAACGPGTERCPRTPRTPCTPCTPCTHPCTIAATLALRRLAEAKRAQTWQNRGVLPGGAGEAARSQPAHMQNRWVGTHRADRRSDLGAHMHTSR